MEHIQQKIWGGEKGVVFGVDPSVVGFWQKSIKIKTDKNRSALSDFYARCLIKYT